MLVRRSEFCFFGKPRLCHAERLGWGFGWVAYFTGLTLCCGRVRLLSVMQFVARLNDSVEPVPLVSLRPASTWSGPAVWLGHGGVEWRRERGKPEACVIFLLSFDLGAQQLLPISAFAVDYRGRWVAVEWTD